MSHQPPIIVGIDLARKPDRGAIMSWDGSVRVVHELPADATVTLHNGQAMVVHPNGPPYMVDLFTGQTAPIDMPARAQQDSNLQHPA